MTKAKTSASKQPSSRRRPALSRFTKAARTASKAKPSTPTTALAPYTPLPQRPRSPRGVLAGLIDEFTDAFGGASDDQVADQAEHAERLSRLLEPCIEWLPDLLYSLNGREIPVCTVTIDFDHDGLVNAFGSKPWELKVEMVLLSKRPGVVDNVELFCVSEATPEAATLHAAALIGDFVDRLKTRSPRLTKGIAETKTALTALRAATRPSLFHRVSQHLPGDNK